MVVTQERLSVEQEIINLWQRLPSDYYRESNLENNFVSPLLNHYLEIDFNLTPANPLIGTGLKPDYLVYRDTNEPPVLVIEDKRRDNRGLDITTLSDEEFAEKCKKYRLYQEAVGYPEVHGNNGIKQYLDKTKVEHQFLANYGLVFNGDFFQLWRRVDGLILPMTPIQRVNEQTIPELIKQLKYCIFEKPKALVTGIWNRKGGVAKTTLEKIKPYFVFE